MSLFPMRFDISYSMTYSHVFDSLKRTDRVTCKCKQTSRLFDTFVMYFAGKSSTETLQFRTILSRHNTDIIPRVVQAPTYLLPVARPLVSKILFYTF